MLWNQAFGAWFISDQEALEGFPSLITGKNAWMSVFLTEYEDVLTVAPITRFSEFIRLCFTGAGRSELHIQPIAPECEERLKNHLGGRAIQTKGEYSYSTLPSGAKCVSGSTREIILPISVQDAEFVLGLHQTGLAMDVEIKSGASVFRISHDDYFEYHGYPRTVIEAVKALFYKDIPVYIRKRIQDTNRMSMSIGARIIGKKAVRVAFLDKKLFLIREGARVKEYEMDKLPPEYDAVIDYWVR
jgi:hypothetical protein